jgi:hypothetical protein
MKNEKEQLDLPVECYRIGELVIPTMEEAVKELLETNHGFIVPLNTCTWNVEGYRGYNKNVYKIAGEKPTSLGINIFSSHGQPFTIDHAETQINNRNELTQENFISWAARFNKVFRQDYEGKPLPKHLWPFYHVKVGDGLYMRPAYQMRDDYTSFVIMGLDKDSVEDSVIPNWSLLWRKFLEKWEK